MEISASKMADWSVSRYCYAGKVADKVVRLLGKHPNTKHQKLGNVELQVIDGVCFIRCNECGELHPIFFEDFRESKFYSGLDTIPEYANVLGNIRLGYDADHVLSACCDSCSSQLHMFYCPICCTFHRSSYMSTTTKINATRHSSSQFGGYTIHGYDNDGDYDTYSHCCEDCKQARLDGDTDYQYDLCERCEEIFLSDDMYWSDHDECMYCEDCYSERDAEIEAEEEYNDNYDSEWHEVYAINDYHGGNHSQRDLGNALAFGAEYEILCFNLYDDTYDRERFCEGLTKHGAITRDASVDLEIVTKPMSLPDLRKNILELAEYCGKHHVRAWNGGKCGLHIHVNRGGIRNFTNIYHFLRDNSESLLKLSGREDTHYCRFNFPASDDELLEECNNYDRYLAVNLENEKTVEFRFLRNTTNRERLEAYFDFIKVLFENDENLPNMTWEDLIEKTDNDFLYEMFNMNRQYPLHI